MNYKGHDCESDLASIADCVNTALRECERGGAQITEWSAPAIKGAINELVYRNNALRRERDVALDKARADAEALMIAHEGRIESLTAEVAHWQAAEQHLCRHELHLAGDSGEIKCRRCGRIDAGDWFEINPICTPSYREIGNQRERREARDVLVADMLGYVHHAPFCGRHERPTVGCARCSFERRLAALSAGPGAAKTEGE